MSPLLALSPLAVAVALLLARRRFGWRGLLFAGGGLILAALATGASCGDIVFYYEGPLNAAGFQSWVLVPATVALVLICAVPPVYVWRFFQPFVAAFLAFMFLAAGFWIA